MKRHNAVKVISDSILADGLVSALFLKGSMARGEDDDYSDVDMYAVVSDENFDMFLSRRIEYLEKYKPLLHWSEVYFVAPQIVGIFEDALHFDLYAVKPDNIPQTGSIKTISDDSGLLSNYKKEPLCLTEDGLSENISEFTYTLIEIEAAYARNDLSRCIYLFYINYGYMSQLTRYVYDKENSLLGNKGMYKSVPSEVYDEYLKILENATPTKILTAIKMLLQLFEKTIAMLPERAQVEMNRKYYDVLSGRLYRLG
ncbi:MAG: hypothetical protein LBH62_09610 [Nitrososphaerota archaeon]|nr:hypothetical protein [Nitrososphaerota archaeon]